MKINTDDVHPEFVEGYRDGYDLSCPEPNANRSERYKHSFAIGRAEKTGKPTPHINADAAYSAADKADKYERERS